VLLTKSQRNGREWLGLVSTPKGLHQKRQRRSRRKQHSLEEVLWRKLSSGWSKRRLSQRLQEVDIVNNQHPYVADRTVTPNDLLTFFGYGRPCKVQKLDSEVPKTVLLTDKLFRPHPGGKDQSAESGDRLHTQKYRNPYT